MKIGFLQAWALRGCGARCRLGAVKTAARLAAWAGSFFDLFLATLNGAMATEGRCADAGDASCRLGAVKTAARHAAGATHFFLFLKTKLHEFLAAVWAAVAVAAVAGWLVPRVTRTLTRWRLAVGRRLVPCGGV